MKTIELKAQQALEDLDRKLAFPKIAAINPILLWILKEIIVFIIYELVKYCKLDIPTALQTIQNPGWFRKIHLSRVIDKEIKRGECDIETNYGKFKFSKLINKTDIKETLLKMGKTLTREELEKMIQEKFN